MRWKPDKRITLQHGAAAPRGSRRWRGTGGALLMALALTLGATRPLPAPAGLNGQSDSTGKTGPDAAGTAQREQLAEDSARLLDMAIVLKAEVGKTNKDVLSMSVIREAGEIEKLARSVRQRTKSASGKPGE